MTKPKGSALAPAITRAAGGLTPQEQDLSGVAIDTFVKALGGKDALVDALAVGGSVPEIDAILTHLLDPRFDTWSLRQICDAAGLTIAELFTHYRKSGIIRAHIQATPIITGKLVGVVDDVMTRAQPYEVPCASCGGVGSVPPRDKKGKILDDAPPEPCRACKASGRMIELPDLERQKLALELGQLVQKSGGINVIANQQNNAFGETARSTATGALEQLQQAVGDLLYGRHADSGEAASASGGVIEAEVVPAVSPTPSPTTLSTGGDLSLGGW